MMENEQSSDRHSLIATPCLIILTVSAIGSLLLWLVLGSFDELDLGPVKDFYRSIGILAAVAFVVLGVFDVHRAVRRKAGRPGAVPDVLLDHALLGIAVMVPGFLLAASAVFAGIALTGIWIGQDRMIAALVKQKNEIETLKTSAARPTVPPSRSARKAPR